MQLLALGPMSGPKRLRLLVWVCGGACAHHSWGRAYLFVFAGVCAGLSKRTNPASLKLSGLASGCRMGGLI